MCILNKLGIMQYPNRLSVIIFALLFGVVACGGGGGPDDGERFSSQTDSTTSENTRTSDSNSNSVASSLLGEQPNESVNSCDQVSTVMCETFEWSSSLAYQASGLDWQNAGWGWVANGDDNVYCNDAGEQSQCALQLGLSASKNTTATPAYYLSDIGAGSGFNTVSVNWSAKWSANWQWGEDVTDHLFVQGLQTVDQVDWTIPVQITGKGQVRILISKDKTCTDDDVILVSEDAVAVNTWQNFALYIELGSETGKGIIELKLNNKLIISAQDLQLRCPESETGINSLMLSSTMVGQNPVSRQTVWYDNFAVYYQ